MTELTAPIEASAQKTPAEASTIQEALRLCSEQFRGKTLYRSAGPEEVWRSTTYDSFMDTALRVARAVIDEGVMPGQKVALMAGNSPLWTAAYSGILLAGAVAVPMDTRLTRDEAANILADSEAALVLYGPEAAMELLPAASTRVMNISTVDWQLREPLARTHECRPEDTASLLYTSGTTGSPKAVVLSHDNFLSDARALFKHELVHSADNVLCILPLHHTYAFMTAFLAPMLVGASVTLPRAIDGPSIVEAANETGVTVLPAVPQLLELMLTKARERISSAPLPKRLLMGGLIALSGSLRRHTGLNLMGVLRKPLGRRFRFFTSGGARLAPEVMIGMEALGFTVIEGYGLTETSPLAAFNPLKKRKPGSVGIPLSPAEIRIFSKPDPPGPGSPENGGQRVGEIGIRGPMVTAGYFRRDDENSIAFQDGWFMSGDLGYLDSEGYLFITGRKKEVVVLNSGKNVYPEEVERHYLGSQLIKEICAYDDKGRLKAVIVPDYIYMKGASIGNAGEAIRWEMDLLSRKLAPHNRVMGYSLRSEPLPRTPLGKLRRFVVKEQQKGLQVKRKDDGTMDADETSRRVARVLGRSMPEPGPVNASDNLELDLAIDSLERLALTVALEQEFSLKLPEGFMSGVHTAGELAQGIRDMGGDGAPAVSVRSGQGLDAVLATLPSKEEIQEAGCHPGILNRPVTWAGLLMVKAAMGVYFGLNARGLDNIPEPPYIICPNHTSFLDGFAVGASLPQRVFRHTRLVGVEDFFRGRGGKLFASLAHVIPIDAEVNLARALALSAHAIREQKSLIIFPEGGRSMDGELLEFRPGIGILALKLKVPVVPAYIHGAFGALAKGKNIPLPHKITVTYGKPVSPSEEMIGSDDFQAFADMVRKEVQRLKNTT